MRPMDIIYLGHSCFLLNYKQVKLVTDPFGEAVGFKQRQAAADIVTISHNHRDHSDLSRIKGGGPRVINGPGEYEVSGVSIIGVAAWHDDKNGENRGKNTIYVIDMGDVRLCHLGDLGHKLTDKQLDLIDGVDVLLIPVGGEVTIGPAEASDVVKQVSPGLVIQMHYKTREHGNAFAKFFGVKEFLDEVGGSFKKASKIKLTKTDVPEETEFVVMERKS